MIVFFVVPVLCFLILVLYAALGVLLYLKNVKSIKRKELQKVVDETLLARAKREKVKSIQ